MNMKTVITATTYALLGGAVVASFLMPHSLLPEASAAEDPVITNVDQIVLYGVDSDTNQLLRYTFNTNTYEPIADLVSEDGTVILDVESLAYIPAGPNKGMYCFPRQGDAQGRLCKIDILTGIVTIKSSLNLGDGPRGMVAMQNAQYEWGLLAASSVNKEILWIDPGSATRTVLGTVGQQYDGLAIDGTGQVFGATTTAIYRIDLTTMAETHVGDHGYAKVEALEFAFGDYSAAVDVPTVPEAWTVNGLLLAFDDNSDKMLIINPNSGQSVEHFSAFSTVDCEGVILLTTRQDPLGFILTNVYD